MKKEILLQVPVASGNFKTLLINRSRNHSISRLQSIIRKTWAYQNLHDMGMSLLRLIIRKTWTYHTII